MPALTSTLGGLRREFDRRRKLAAVANGRIVKTSSAPSPIPSAPAGAASAPIPRKPAAAAMIRRPSVPTPRKPAEAAAKKSYAPPPPTRPASSPTSRLTAPRLLSSSPAFNSKTIKKGSTVLVRTRVGALPSGMGLVLWLSAVVVSDAADDGCYEVMYNGDFPRHDPFRTVRVARDEVKSMPSQQ